MGRGRGNRGKRGGNRGGGRGGRGGGRENNWSGHRPDYPEIAKENEQFERYYDTLEVVPQEERAEFWETLKRQLPNSFRFTGSKGHALAVQQRLIDDYIPKIKSMQFNGANVDPPTPLEWFPGKLAWSMTTPKQVVRKFAPFAEFQRFLVSETSIGNISRQEVVSMIPPLLMDLQPGMTVLDLCAAPGSKSAQLIELVHAGEEARIRKIIHGIANDEKREASPDGIEVEVDNDADLKDDWSDDGRATGLLIANDINYTRAQMLVHQVKRLNSPNLIVTNHDASQYPSIRIPSDNGRPRYLKFDRILADVPCSGDGTPRKNYTVWKDWSSRNAMGLHTMQLRILVRALQMLKVGGRVVYSTCSMNPIENEAVVASAIYRCGGVKKVRLAETSSCLPGLIRRPGLKAWKVMDKTGEFWDSYEDMEKNGAGGDEKLHESLFPPTEQENLPLENCMRVYAHLQDTGAFFIAVLEKTSEIRELRPENQRRRKIDAPKRPHEEEVDGTANAKRLKVVDVANGEFANGEFANGESANGEAEIMGETAHGTTEEVTATTGDCDIEAIDVEAEDIEETGNSNGLDGGAQLPTTGTVSTVQDLQSLNEGAPLPATAKSLGTIPAKSKQGQPREEPFIYLSPDHPELTRIYDFYNLSSRFPRHRFMVRNATGEPVKGIYYTTQLASDILKVNAGRGMKFVQSGVKMFMRQDAQGQDICRWRIQSEGMPIIEPWVGEDRVVRLYQRDTFRKLLKEMFPKVNGDNWKDFNEIGERVREIPMGCCVLRVEPSEGENGFKERMVFPLWRSIASINIMLAKEEKIALLLRLYNDNTGLIDNSKESKALEAQARAEEAAKAEPPPQPKAEGELPASELEAESAEQSLDAAEAVVLGEKQAEVDAGRGEVAERLEEEDVFNKTV